MMCQCLYRVFLALQSILTWSTRTWLAAIRIHSKAPLGTYNVMADASEPHWRSEHWARASVTLTTHRRSAHGRSHMTHSTHGSGHWSTMAGMEWTGSHTSSKRTLSRFSLRWRAFFINTIMALVLNYKISIMFFFYFFFQIIMSMCWII